MEDASSRNISLNLQRGLPCCNVLSQKQCSPLQCRRAARRPGSAMSPNLWHRKTWQATSCAAFLSCAPQHAIAAKWIPELRYPARKKSSWCPRGLLPATMDCKVLMSIGTLSPVPAPVATLTMTLSLNWCTEMKTLAGPSNVAATRVGGLRLVPSKCQRKTSPSGARSQSSGWATCSVGSQSALRT